MLLFQVLAERHERGSVIITSNLGFGDWTQVLGNANLTATLLDRLTTRHTSSNVLGRATGYRRHCKAKLATKTGSFPTLGVGKPTLKQPHGGDQNCVITPG